MWLSVTDVCNMRCKYCFVKKGSSFLRFEQIKPVMDFFLSCEPAQKRVDYYGGEPLLNYALLQKSMPYALNEGARKGKDVRTYISTNAALYDPKMTALKDCGVHVLVSIDGGRETHDANRRMPDGSPSFDKVVAGVKKMQDTLEPNNLCALFTIAPEYAARAYENFDELLALGFRCINVEPERTRRWEPRQIADFLENLEKIAKKTVDSILGDPSKRLFLNSISRYLAAYRGDADNPSGCPFEENLVVYPDGTISLPPTIVFEDLKNLFQVGDCARGLFPAFENCAFDPAGQSCQACRRKATNLESVRDNGVQMKRNLVLQKLADEVILKAKTDPLYSDYILEADEWTYV